MPSRSSLSRPFKFIAHKLKPRSSATSIHKFLPATDNGAATTTKPPSWAQRLGHKKKAASHPVCQPVWGNTSPAQPPQGLIAAITNKQPVKATDLKALAQADPYAAYATVVTANAADWQLHSLALDNALMPAEPPANLPPSPSYLDYWQALQTGPSAPATATRNPMDDQIDSIKMLMNRLKACLEESGSNTLEIPVGPGNTLTATLNADNKTITVQDTDAYRSGGTMGTWGLLQGDDSLEVNRTDVDVFRQTSWAGEKLTELESACNRLMGLG